MIAYRVTKPQLEALIEAEAPGWLQNAATRTDRFRQKGFYEERSSIWSEVKGVYMRLQGDCKCAFCERKLESKLTKEKPFLICPVGDFDDAPEDLIRFHGVSPQPVALNGYDRERALVTIEFFKLDDEAKRKNLLRERVLIIVALHPQLEKLANGATGNAKTEAQKLVDGFTGSQSAHTNCARCFRNLFQKNRVEAKAVFDGALKLINSIS